MTVGELGIVANMGTPLLWSAAFHLIFGNALIASFEAMLLSRIFKVPRIKLFMVLVFANYASAWCGVWLLSRKWVDLSWITIENILLAHVGLLGVAFVFTLLMELPFFYYGLKKYKVSLSGVLKGAVVANLASYTIMCAWYWLVGSMSMATDLKVVDPSEMNIPDKYQFYYLSEDKRHVLRSDLAGERVVVLAEIEACERSKFLAARQNDQGGVDLYLMKSSDPKSEPEQQLLVSNFADRVSWLFREKEKNEDLGDEAKESRNKLLIKTESDWKFSSKGGWAPEGLRASNKSDGRRLNYSLNTPLTLRWRLQNLVHLEGDVALFLLGGDQICVFDPEGKRIALLARGGGRLVGVRSAGSSER